MIALFNIDILYDFDIIPYMINSTEPTELTALILFGSLKMNERNMNSDAIIPIYSI